MFDIARGLALPLTCLVVLAVGCAKGKPPPEPLVLEASAPSSNAPVASWPALPDDESRAAKLIQERTRRSPSPELSLTLDLVVRALTEAALKGRLRAGWEAIAASIGDFMNRASAGGRPSFVLIGTMHDAPSHVVAFRRLFGALGAAVSDASLEQFHASGQWAGLDAGSDWGDSALLNRFSADGDRRSLEALIRAQRDHNHAAWKYDYLEELPALAATLRASGVALHGCDMPTALQRSVASAGDEAALRLRELHCVLSLQERMGPRSARARVAMLWGREHVRAVGAQRFLPVSADVMAVTVLGGRPRAAEGLDSELARRLRLGAPLLIPIEDGHRFVLVLPEGDLAALTDRARTGLEPGDVDRPNGLVVSSDRDVELLVGGKRHRIAAKPSNLPLPPGDHAFVALAPQVPRLAGAISVPEHGFVELELEPDKSSIRVVIHRAH